MLHGHQSSSGSARLRHHFTELHLNGAPHPPLYVARVAKCARAGEQGSSIAKDLIDSEDPKHTLFCCETAFVAIYAFFKG